MAEHDDISGLPSHAGLSCMMQAGELVKSIDEALAKLDLLSQRVGNHPRGPMFENARVPLKLAREHANTALRDMAWDLCGGNRER